MEKMQVSQHMGQVFKRTLRYIERMTGAEVAEFDWQDVNHRDALARELYHDTKVVIEECIPLMRDLVQPSPGGLLALAWLSRVEQISGDMLQSFACGLIPGEPVEGALQDKDAAEVFERLTQGMHLTYNARVIIAIHLLSTVFIDAPSRVAALEKVMVLPSFGVRERKLIYAWAMGLEITPDVCDNGSIELPDPPVALARVAVCAMVDLGWSGNDVVRHIITSLSDLDARYVLHGVLDLIERDTDLQATIRRQAFEVCLQQTDASLRRRVYRLAARTESKEFLQLAIKDPDYNVRRWALGLLKDK